MKTTTLALRLRELVWGRAILFAIFSVLTTNMRASAEQTFSSPDQAVNALVTAAKARDTYAFHTIFGPPSQDLISADIVQASEEFDRFVRRVTEKTEQARESDSRIWLRLGADAWPFPIPLLRRNGAWFFDSEA